jgi:hypothetical protein
MKYFWFGDSWVVGDELVTASNHKFDKTFAYLTSKHFNAECQNLGECGSSYDDIVYQFYQALPNITRKDTVFFCLTANHRVSFFDNTGKIKRVMPNQIYEKQKPHPYRLQWYKYFDSPAQRIFNQDKNINLLHYWCKDKGIRHFFCNLFTTESDKLIDDVPEKYWLFSKNTCLASTILPIIDSENLYLDDHPNLTNEQWNMQQQAVDQYIRPNWAHPNEKGHAKIAEALIKKLKKQT